jgi:hypothetical protein
MKKGTSILFMTAFMSLFIMNFSASASHIEVKALYFQPTEQAFKDIYGSGMSYGGEVNIHVFKGLNVWIGAEHYSKKGELTFTKETTDIQITPIYGGVKYIFQGKKINPYVGVGMGFFQYKESNPIGEVKESKVGFVVQAGLSISVFGPALVDLQVGYNWCKIKPQEIEADIGGLKAGIGIGFSF